jgi:hypothetical protein
LDRVFALTYDVYGNQWPVAGVTNQGETINIITFYLSFVLD